jgi:ribosomal protein S18 acetylase RimI-like enzyme
MSALAGPLTAASWYLYWMCVRPVAQRLGLAQALQPGGSVRPITRRRADRSETSGRSDYGRARRFYEQAGYLPVGRIPDFYRTGDDCLIIPRS